MNPYECEGPTQSELDEEAEEAAWLASLYESAPPECWCCT